MPERLKKRSMRVVGVRQVLRALKGREAEEAFLALDAAPHLRQQITEAAREAGDPVRTVATMEELSQLCRVDVPSAAAAILKSDHADGKQSSLPDASKDGESFD